MPQLLVLMMICARRKSLIFGLREDCDTEIIRANAVSNSAKPDRHLGFKLNALVIRLQAITRIAFRSVNITIHRLKTLPF